MTCAWNQPKSWRLALACEVADGNSRWGGDGGDGDSMVDELQPARSAQGSDDRGGKDGTWCLMRILSGLAALRTVAFQLNCERTMDVTGSGCSPTDH